MPGARTHDDGFALVGVLVVSTLLLALGAFATRAARIELRIAHNDLLHKQALAAAEAGLNHAFVLIGANYADGFDDELSGGGTGGGLTTVGPLLAVGGLSYRFRSFGNASGDGYYVRVVDNFDEIPSNEEADADARIKIISRGQVGGAVRTIEGVIVGDRLFPPFGLFGDKGVDISGGSTIDSYDSAVGPYPNGPGDNGDVGSNGDIVLGGSGTTVNGDTVAGGTVDPDPGTVTGDVTEGSDPVSLPPVPVCGPPYSDGAGITGGYYSPATGKLKSQMGGAPRDIVLNPGTYCFSEITLTAGKTLSVTGKVIIYLTGGSDLSGGSLINPGQPRDLLIVSSYTGGGSGLKVAGGSASRAGIYAPGAEVDITGNGEFFGAVVGSRVSVPGGARFHYDEDLARIPGLTVRLVNWREVREL